MKSSARALWMPLALTFLLLSLYRSSAGEASKPGFELREGDRVVLLGDTLIEREQLYGYLEQRLTVQFPGKNIIFRNLGWSADTPAGESRAAFDFDKPGKGFERLTDQLAAVRPTVVFLGYGMANSFDGATNVANFTRQLGRLIDVISGLNTNHPARFVILSPVRHEKLPAPLPDPTAHNRQLEAYVQALRLLASEKGCEFISLYDALGADAKRRPDTVNGIHLSDSGYWQLAQAVAKGLRWDSTSRNIQATIDRSGALRTTTHGVAPGDPAGHERVRFYVLDERLVDPVLPAQKPLETLAGFTLKVAGLEPGNYELRIDGVKVQTATHQEWRRGVPIRSGPQFDQAEDLRQAILKKNELFFNRWRPQNETYLFGFRKHEQGQNAKEIPMFDPLIEEQEKRIAQLREPRKHSYELIRVYQNRPRYRMAKAGAAQQSTVVSAAPSQAASIPQFVIADGLELTLFAESPLLAKPIQMNFDPKGRLWIASSAVYPQIQPGQVANDKILVLEDTNGDGFAEKSTVFAEGLLIPTGVEPGDDGVYVGQSTQLLHFRDTDGDGKADEKRIVLSGFGTEDTHHIVHTLHWGPDGQLYFNQSIYIHSHIETPHGVERLNSGGLWHLRPATQQLGVFLRGFCNPWGHQFDEFGQSFVTDGAGFQGISFGIPGATYFTYADMRRELKSVSPGNYPKFCGLELVHSAHFPADWQGNAVTCDFRAHRIVRFAIEEKDSGYVTRELPDVLQTTNVTFRPIDIKLGPDGALYIADWSNPIIQHGEVDFRDPRRDHEHGRIWRVSVKGQPPLKSVNLVGAQTQQLLDTLLSPNLYEQQQARRVLLERGQAIAADLARWTKKQTDEKAVLQALWMYQGIDKVQPELLQKVLEAKDGRIRAGAVRVLSFWQDRIKQHVDLLAARVKDEHPRVRLEAVRALAGIADLRCAELVLSALDKPMDPFLDYGIWLSINELAPIWVAGVKANKWNPAGREQQLEFALKAIKPELAADVLAQVVPGKEIPANGSGPWIELIGSAGDAALLTRLFEQVLAGRFEPEATVRALNALENASRKREQAPAVATQARLSELMSQEHLEMRQPAIRLAGAWKLKEFVPQFLTIAAEPSTPDSVRQAAFDSLRDIGGNRVIQGVTQLTADPNSLKVRQQALLVLAAMKLDSAVQPAVKVLSDTTNEAESLELWRKLLTVKGAGAKLAQALPKTDLPAVMASAGLRVAREGGRAEPDLVWALTRGANLETESQMLSPEELHQLAAKVTAEGDPARGELIARRKELNCFTCHAIGGVGGKVGPDLTSIGASAPVDYLIESILYPNRKIKEGFHSVIVETSDALEYSGVLVSENSDQLVLRDSTDKETTIPKNTIKTRATGVSLMPGGLVDQLSSSERLDLYRFLSELGKPGAYDAAKGNVARSWKLLAETHEMSQFGEQKALSTAFSDKSWISARSFVDGRLPKSELTAALAGMERRSPQAVYAAATFELAREGEVSLLFSGQEGSPVWIDRKPSGACPSLKTTLTAGTHTVVVRLDASKLPESIRLEAPDATFLSKW